MRRCQRLPAPAQPCPTLMQKLINQPLALLLRHAVPVQATPGAKSRHSLGAIVYHRIECIQLRNERSQNFLLGFRRHLPHPLDDLKPDTSSVTIPTLPSYRHHDGLTASEWATPRIGLPSAGSDKTTSSPKH